MSAKMLDFTKKKKGFTLLEIIVTLTLAAVLAAISGVFMSGWHQAALKEEAFITMRKIRTAERLYYTEYGEYSDNISDADPGNLGINSSELDREYFSHECYQVNTNLGEISCNPASSTADGKRKVSGIGTFTMNINTGTII